MKVCKILYWVLFALGAALFILNFFFQHIAIMISALVALLLAIVFYFMHANLKKKEDATPQVDKRSVELQRQREDSYKRIREAKKAKKENKK